MRPGNRPGFPRLPLFARRVGLLAQGTGLSSSLPVCVAILAQGGEWREWRAGRRPAGPRRGRRGEARRRARQIAPLHKDESRFPLAADLSARAPRMERAPSGKSAASAVGWSRMTRRFARVSDTSNHGPPLQMGRRGNFSATPRCKAAGREASFRPQRQLGFHRDSSMVARADLEVADPQPWNRGATSRSPVWNPSCR